MSHPANCRLVGIEVAGEYVLAIVLSGETPVGGSTVSGNFSSFGERPMINESTGSAERVKIILHATEYEAILNEAHKHCDG